MLFILITEFLAFLLILRLRGAPYSTPLFLLLLCMRINFTSLKPSVAGPLLSTFLHVKKLKRGEDTR